MRSRIHLPKCRHLVFFFSLFFFVDTLCYLIYPCRAGRLDAGFKGDPCLSGEEAWQVPWGIAIVVISVQSAESHWYWNIGPPVRWQLFIAEWSRWSELQKKPVLYPIIINTDSQKILNCIGSPILLSELRPFWAAKKGKQEMLRIIGEEALPKNCVHRDHGRKRDPKQHLPCGSSSIQWVTLNERDAFHRSPVDVNLVYWDQKLTFLNWNVSLQESLNILTLFQFERKTNIQISESSCARAMSLPHVLCRCIYYFVHCIWFLFFFPVESF